ncbi:MAG: hypothetical protein FWD32_00365 [Firmicutes bacterium]|nr:hypothetical protein [Bacillota bacterium]
MFNQLFEGSMLNYIWYCLKSMLAVLKIFFVGGASDISGRDIIVGIITLIIVMVMVLVLSIIVYKLVKQNEPVKMSIQTQTNYWSGSFMGAAKVVGTLSAKVAGALGLVSMATLITGITTYVRGNHNEVFNEMVKSGGMATLTSFFPSGKGFSVVGVISNAILDFVIKLARGGYRR